MKFEFIDDIKNIYVKRGVIVAASLLLIAIFFAFLLFEVMVETFKVVRRVFKENWGPVIESIKQLIESKW